FFALYISAQKVVENRYNLGLAHNKKRNMLLDGLKVNKTQDFENSVIEDIADFTVSANPAKSFIDITFSTAPKGNTTINIVSIDGRTISSQTIRENSEELKIFRMMLPELNHGLYLVSVVFENNLKMVKKVVVK
ncbi:MAG TPA: T9SS type A sorting domain-containing protein, partial [Salinivirgaceae bacterium]|nr:T9SS type A sorting domain-containing protein [Salinivirgaceae bacterium]